MTVRVVGWQMQANGAPAYGAMVGADEPSRYQTYVAARYTPVALIELPAVIEALDRVVDAPSIHATLVELQRLRTELKQLTTPAAAGGE